MKNAVVIKEKDFLFDISIVATPYAKERNEWVNNHVDVWNDDHIVSDVPEVYLILPAFIAVTSVANLCRNEVGFDRYVTSVDFCTSLDEIKDTIEHKLICEPIGSTARIDLFMFNGLRYEQIPYDIGTYKKIAPETKLELTLDALGGFEFEKMLTKKYCEKDCFCELEGRPVFIEIPDIWEIEYQNFDFEDFFLDDRTSFWRYRNLESVIEDALYELYENSDLATIYIENSWYSVALEIDRKSYEQQKNTEVVFDCFELFKSFAKVTITLNC